MKLITKEIEQRLKKVPLYSQDGKGVEAICVAKFFLPVGAWTWYVTEADLSTRILYGVTINGIGQGEFGYTSIDELQHLKTRFGLTIERDIYFEPMELKDIDDSYLQKFLERMYGE